MPVAVRRRPARQRRGHGRGREDGPRRQGQQGHRPAPEPPRPAGGRALRRRRPAVPRRQAGRPRRRPTSASSAQIERVDVDVLNHIAQDYIPVVASVGADREGNSYNVNADEAAGAVARALGAYKVIFLTDVAGWLRDPTTRRASSPRPAPTRSRPRSARSPAACARSSRRASTRSTAASTTPTSSTAGSPHALLLELFTDAGLGTKIRAAA